MTTTPEETMTALLRARAALRILPKHLHPFVNPEGPIDWLGLRSTVDTTAEVAALSLVAHLLGMGEALIGTGDPGWTFSELLEQVDAATRVEVLTALTLVISVLELGA